MKKLFSKFSFMETKSELKHLLIKFFTFTLEKGMMFSMKKISSPIKAIFFDLDGTLYFKGKPIQGAIETINQLKNWGYICRFLTNTDAVDETVIHEKLINMGFDIDVNEIYTPITASIIYLKSKKNVTIYPLVGQAIMHQYTCFNCALEDVDYVIIGDCKDKINYLELNNVFRLIHRKAEILALQKGKYFYDVNGVNMDTGAIVAMMEYITDKKATILGKPSSDFFNTLMKQLKLNENEILIVGDDKNTDIMGAKCVGAKSVLVKTGKYNDQRNLTDYIPDYTIDSIIDIGIILENI